jgi:hypothetical protein
MAVIIWVVVFWDATPYNGAVTQKTTIQEWLSITVTILSNSKPVFIIIKKSVLTSKKTRPHYKDKFVNAVW